jgi:hypothetical protein
VTPGTALGPGTHTFWVQTFNGAGYGPFSAPLGFTVAGAPPPATTLQSPSGTISDTTPTYTWSAVSTATWYYLWVNGPGGSAVLRRWYTASQAGCGGGTGTCAVTPGTVLGPGTHTFWVQTFNGAGYGPFSAPLGFTVAPSGSGPRSAERPPAGSASSGRDS